MTGRHRAPPHGSAARDATARPYVGLHESPWESQDCPDDAPDGRCWDCGATRREPHTAACPLNDWEPDDPPRCTSCGHLEADECGCTCCTWTCDERPADV